MSVQNYYDNLFYELEKNKQLKLICKQAFKEKYKDDIPSGVVERLAQELQLTEQNQHSAYYLEMIPLIQQQQWKPWQIGFEGTTGSSFICYLCGITDVNPMDKNVMLYPEFFMGYQGNKLPFFGLVTKEQSENIRLLESLVEKTGVYPSYEEVSKPELVQVLRRKDMRFLDFEDVMRIALLNGTNPKSYAELVHIMGVLCSDGATDDITCREDVYEAVMECGIDRKTAFCIAESVRRGKGLKAEWKELLLQKEFLKRKLKACEQARYLCSRGYAAERVLQNLRLLYYKVNFPYDFLEVYDEVDGGKKDA